MAENNKENRERLVEAIIESYTHDEVVEFAKICMANHLCNDDEFHLTWDMMGWMSQANLLQKYPEGTADGDRMRQAFVDTKGEAGSLSDAESLRLLTVIDRFDKRKEAPNE